MHIYTCRYVGGIYKYVYGSGVDLGDDAIHGLDHVGHMGGAVVRVVEVPALDLCVKG